MITMTPLQLAIGVIVIAVLAGIAVMLLRHRRTAALKTRFGHEYDHALRHADSASEAETLLHEREKRVAAFDIRPLARDRRDAFVADWRKVQAQFVDDPAGAVARADVLLGQVMEARGYPVTDFEQRSADLSVGHGDVVQHYRTAHTIAERHARGEAGTEDLRQAMIHYRALFDDLVNEPEGDAKVIEHRDGRVRDLRREKTGEKAHD